MTIRRYCRLNQFISGHNINHITQYFIQWTILFFHFFFFCFFAFFFFGFFLFWRNLSFFLWWFQIRGIFIRRMLSFFYLVLCSESPHYFHFHSLYHSHSHSYLQSFQLFHFYLHPLFSFDPHSISLIHPYILYIDHSFYIHPFFHSILFSVLLLFQYIASYHHHSEFSIRHQLIY